LNPPPTFPIPLALDSYLSRSRYKNSFESVKSLFRTFFDMNDGTIHLVQGYFEDTIPLHHPAAIAILRMDGDLYSSTKVVLEHLYDSVLAGGWVIVDDYDWRQKIVAEVTTKLCKEAVDEFRAKREIKEPLLGDPPSWKKQ
jgi:hypothetical protein